MSIQDELLRSIDLMIQKSVSNLEHNDVSGIVTDCRNGKYQVNIMGQDYWMKDGVKCAPSIGSAVWCRVPNGRWNDIFIEGIK